MSSKPSAENKAQHFLQQSSLFQLGCLPTEAPHPRTTRLSQMSSDDLEGAIRLLKDVELQAIGALDLRAPEITELAREIRSTLESGARIFFCGCGATGRLSLSLEVLWREECERLGREECERPGRDDWTERVVSFIAGGDFALVRSIENFEDFPEYGARQLNDLGFQQGDLLISTTEGGETPFVIGATEEAARASKRKPYFLYCNPEDVLASTVERSRRVLENPRIRSVSLVTGPMAVAGSTRLQATTALMLAAGSALFLAFDPRHEPARFIRDFRTHLETADLERLAPLIRRESEIYAKGDLCVHRAAEYAITVVTDTTERSPTFSLAPFENAHDPQAQMAWTYLCVPGKADSLSAWKRVLRREPRALDWMGFKERFGQDALLGFDFSPASQARREARHGTARVHAFDFERAEWEMLLRLDEIEVRLPRPTALLTEHLLLKIALNVSSTLVMGRLGRFKGNLMLYVRAANNKLVDRAIRFVQILLKDSGIESCSYEDICYALFATAEGLGVDEPVVLRTFERLVHAERVRGQATGS